MELDILVKTIFTMCDCHAIYAPKVTEYFN